MVWRFWLTLFGGAFRPLHPYLAAAVYVDAKKRRFDRINLPPGWWALATFFFSLWGFFVYWVVHHSTLAVREQRPPF